jgi:MFS family permease
MGGFVDLWRREPAARPFFLAVLQSALGTGAAYVAIMVVAYDRLGSAWAASLVLLADILPGMLLGPVVGAWLDRRDRRRSAALADGLRAVALAGIIVVPGAAGMLALAVVAGLGSTIFRPAVFGLLPSTVDEERRMAAVALWSATGDAGMTLGPALAAACIAVGGASLLLAVNAAAFAGCALLLTRLRPGHAVEEDEHDDAESLADGVREGVRFVLRDPIMRVMVAVTGGVTLCAAMMNVAEVLLARQSLHVGGDGFAAMVAVFGVGMVAGSLASGRSTGPRRLSLGLVGGLAVTGLGLLGSSLAPSLPCALFTFFVTGFGSSLEGAHSRGLAQHLVPQRLLSRFHSINGTLESWGFAGAAVTAGALASLWGARGVFAVSGAAIVLISALTAATLLRRVQQPVAQPAPVAA